MSNSSDDWRLFGLPLVARGRIQRRVEMTRNPSCIGRVSRLMSNAVDTSNKSNTVESCRIVGCCRMLSNAVGRSKAVEWSNQSNAVDSWQNLSIGRCLMNAVESCRIIEGCRKLSIAVGRSNVGECCRMVKLLNDFECCWMVESVECCRKLSIAVDWSIAAGCCRLIESVECNVELETRHM